MKYLLTIMALVATATVLGGCLSHHKGPLPGEPADATFETVNDTRLRYVDSGGEGPTVVMIHGFASSLNVWAGVMPALTDDHRVIALDLKGFGWSGRPEGDYDPDTQAELVFGLLDELGVDKASLVAHSWGSSVALSMAHLQPERIDRIALYDAWVYEEQLPVFFYWSRLGGLGELLFSLYYRERPADKIEMAFYDPSIIPQALVDDVEEQLDRPGTSAAALAAVRGQVYDETQKRYASIDHPVLLLWGREDGVTTLDFAERLYTDLPNAELVVYPRCGHFPMIEAHAPSTRDLAAFLEVDDDSTEEVEDDVSAPRQRRLESAPSAEQDAEQDESDAAPAPAPAPVGDDAEQKEVAE